ncbi:MAG: hypothetical protein ACOX5G_12510 [Kiritimatiellia bacterium]
MSKIILHDGTGSGSASAPPPKKPSFLFVLLTLAILGALSGLSIAMMKRSRQAAPPAPAEGGPAAPALLPAPEPPPSRPGTEAARPDRPPPAGGPAARRAAETAGASEASAPESGGAASNETTAEAAGEEPAAQAKEPAFKTHTEQLISMMEGIPAGVPVPPLPLSDIDDLEADADEAAVTDIVINEDDSERLEAHKVKVGWTKLDLAEARKEGWTTVEYLKALEQVRNEDAQFAHEKRQEFDALLADAELSDDECLAGLEEINAELEERGLPPIKPRFEGETPAGGPRSAQ